MLPIIKDGRVVGMITDRDMHSDDDVRPASSAVGGKRSSRVK